MKLTLSISVSSYDDARYVCNVLHNAGFNAIVSSPFNNAYCVVVSTRPEFVNQGADMYEEIKLAETLARTTYETLCAADKY